MLGGAVQRAKDSRRGDSVDSDDRTRGSMEQRRPGYFAPAKHKVKSRRRRSTRPAVSLALFCQVRQSRFHSCSHKMV
eukprot:1284348-Prymnesium_polylepis.2